MTVQLAPPIVFHSVLSTGAPNAFGTVATYIAGTTTPQATYIDSTQTTQNQNPTPLNVMGQASIWLATNLVYKIVVFDAAGNQINFQDQIYGGANLGSVSTSIIPTPTNTLTLGNVTNSWANVYVGANNAPVLDTASGNIGYYKQTAAEAAASITPVDFAYLPFDIRRYGGDPTGAAPSDTALTSALAVCGTAGGTIRFPGIGGTGGSNYTLANQYSLSQRSAIVFQGDGSPTSAGANGTKLTYTGTASPWFSCPNATGILFENMTLAASNAGFTGTFIKYGAVAGNPSAFCGLDNVAIGNSATAATHLDLDATIQFSARRCLFQNASSSGAVLGQAPAGGSFSNVIKFDACEWTGCNGTLIQYGGEAWTFDQCTFEKLVNGTVIVFSSTSNTTNKGLTFKNCWQGDTTVGGTVAITYYGQGLILEGGRWTGTATSTLLSLNNAKGILVGGGAILEAWGTVIDFTTTTIASVALRDVRMTGITNVFGTVANAPLNLVYNPVSVSNIASPIAPPSTCGSNAQNGWKVDPDGRVTQWGLSVVTTGTPLAVTFNTNGITFPNAIWNLQTSFGAASGTTNTVTPSSISTAGFTLNVAGVAGSSNVYWTALGN